MALLFWSAEFVRPADRGLPENTRSDMHYAATRKGVQPLRETERPAPMSSREGLQYIANRRGVQAFDAPGGDTADGLFNADGKADLQEEIRKLEAHPDCTEWRGIISFKKADLRRIGYDDPEAMRGLLRARMPDVAKQYGISPENLVWNAAYHPVDKHGDDHHPHYHVYFYSTDPAEGNKPAPPSRLEKARSILTNDLFRNDLSEIQAVGREARAALQEAMETWPPEQLAAWEIRLHRLHDVLPSNGKKTYAFLPAAVKKQVDTLLREWIAQPGAAPVYDRLKGAQRRYVAAYNDDPDKIERRMAEWEKHFFHPTGRNDRATLHNRIIRLAQSCAAEAPLPEYWEPEPELSPKAASAPVYGSAEKRAYRLSKLADEWYSGNRESGLWLSRMLRRERPDIAAYMLRHLAEQGVRPALHDLSRHEEDPLKKRRMLREAAGVDGPVSARDPDALYDLARHCEWELDDRGEAVIYYEMAAEQNYDAAIRLATIYGDPDMAEEGFYDPARAAYMRESAYTQLQRAMDTDDDADWKRINKAQLQLGFLYQQSGEMYNAVLEYGAVALRQAAHPDTYNDRLMQRAQQALSRIRHNERWRLCAADQERLSKTGADDRTEDLTAYSAGHHVPEWQRPETWHLSDTASEMAMGLYSRFEQRSIDDLLQAFDSPAPWLGYSPELRDALHLLRQGNPEALVMLQVEADTNNIMGALQLGRLYETGGIVEKDAAQAKRYYTRAHDLLRTYRADLADHNQKPDRFADYHLGRLLWDGKGCESNREEGLALLKQAARQGCQPAGMKLSSIYFPPEALREYAATIRTVEALQLPPPEKLPPLARAELRQTAQQIVQAAPPDLRGILQKPTEERLLQSVHYRQVNEIISGIYAAARTMPEPYARLAQLVRPEDTPATLSPEARVLTARLLPPITSRLDPEAHEKTVRAILDIAVQKRIQNLLEEPSIRVTVRRETAKLRELIRRYACTRYSDRLPEAVRQCLAQTCERLTACHEEFAACAAADPARWKRQVFGVAREQVRSDNQLLRMTRSSVAEILFVAQSLERLAEQATRRNEQPSRDTNRTSRQNRRDNRRPGQRTEAASEEQKKREIEPESPVFAP